MKPSYHPSQIEPVPKKQAFKFQDPLRNQYHYHGTAITIYVGLF
jgi:hypothetical protein